MTAHKALVIEDAYLHAKDASRFNDLIVIADEGAVQMTTIHGNAITLKSEDLAAIQRLVDGAEKTQPATKVTVTIAWPPDWSKIPAKYDFAAVNRNGLAYAYKNYPLRGRNFGQWYGSFPLWLGTVAPEINWETSLCERPAPDELAVLGITWADVPARCNYVAADKRGSVYGYVLRPHPNNIVSPDPFHFPLDDNVWMRDRNDECFGIYLHDATLPADLDWRNTLFVRPGYTEPRN